MSCFPLFTGRIDGKKQLPSMRSTPGNLRADFYRCETGLVPDAGWNISQTDRYPVNHGICHDWPPARGCSHTLAGWSWLGVQSQFYGRHQIFDCRWRRQDRWRALAADPLDLSLWGTLSRSREAFDGRWAWERLQRWVRVWRATWW